MSKNPPGGWGTRAASVAVLFLAASLTLIWLNKIPPPEKTAELERVATITTGFANGEQHAEINGAVLCVSDPFTQVNFYSLTNPAAPAFFASVQVPGTTKGIAHHDRFFYLCGEGWLRAFSCSSNFLVITNSEILVESNTLTRLKVRNGYLVAAAFTPGRIKQGRIYIFSLADPAAPRLVSTLVSPPRSGFADVEIKDNLLYACDYFGKRIEVYDIADIEHPQRVHSQTIENHHDYSSFEPWRMLIKDNALYVQDDDSWQVFSIRDPINPAYRFDLQVARDIEGSRLVGDMLMWSASGVNEGVSGVLVYDCRNAFHPALIGRTDFGPVTGFYWGDMDEQHIYQPDGASLHVLKVPQIPASSRMPSKQPRKAPLDRTSNPVVP
jgi:hypothetical protein